MDYNSYLCGVYGARGSNGHMLGYHTIAREMEILALLHTNSFPVPGCRVLQVSGDFIGKPILSGVDVRKLALKHLKEIWPTYFEGGDFPLPAADELGVS